ncbi:MAG: hypothetical protein V1709_05250 [Planctomycetota bacterium]
MSEAVFLLLPCAFGRSASGGQDTDASQPVSPECWDEWNVRLSDPDELGAVSLLTGHGKYC